MPGKVCRAYKADGHKGTRIESTQQGQEALKKHLSLMQRLRKEVAQAEEQKSAMLNDYMTNHSDKTWQEYLAMVKGAKKGETKK